MEASARCGIVFQNSTNNVIEVKVKDNTMIFQKMEILEFTSGWYCTKPIVTCREKINDIYFIGTERKRMSVIVKDDSDDYWLYCKGADSAILPLIVSGKINETIAHVADFSMVRFSTFH